MKVWRVRFHDRSAILVTAESEMRAFEIADREKYKASLMPVSAEEL